MGRTSIYVKDISKLKDYGFIERKTLSEQVYYDFRGKGTMPLYMRVACETGKMLTQCMTIEALEVLCKMYKDGVVVFEAVKKEPKTYMRVTAAEAEIIRKLREEK